MPSPRTIARGNVAVKRSPEVETVAMPVWKPGWVLKNAATLPGDPSEFSGKDPLALGPPTNEHGASSSAGRPSNVNASISAPSRYIWTTSPGSGDTGMLGVLVGPADPTRALARVRVNVIGYRRSPKQPLPHVGVAT